MKLITLVIFIVSEIPTITIFLADQIQTLNESPKILLSCIVNSSTSTNISISDPSTGKVVSSGILTDILNFTDTSAKCHHTAWYICKAANSGGDIQSNPVKIFANCTGIV